MNIKLNSNRDLKGFMASVHKLGGAARAVQGETNVDAKSTLGIASIMANGEFELRFINCTDNGLFDKWKV
ncbi:hypothetical protein [Ruminococcus sp. HUN007]|uniref:hypothetical protein n=1 Tax=Ruminococcus sp. HUN007 TaxID=1514668 RepID=UPI0005D2CBB7|nr:hypothetical protein [Ruminococcus sp. HUN007]